jgi:hypothetical protein
MYKIINDKWNKHSGCMGMISSKEKILISIVALNIFTLNWDTLNASYLLPWNLLHTEIIHTSDYASAGTRKNIN